MENLEYVPMIWGIDDDTKTQEGAQTVLTYNEPNIISQSNIKAEIAAKSWPEIEKALAGKQISSPSASTCAGEDCLDSRDNWFKVFFDICATCNVDFIATHAYGCDADEVMEDLKILSEKNDGKKIWLTEFACGTLKNPSLMLIFMKQILPQLENADFILRYSWYKGIVVPPMDGSTEFVTPAASLLEQNGEKHVLTALGDFYNNYKPGDVVEIKVDEIPVVVPSNLFNENCPVEDTTGADKSEVWAILKEYNTNPTLWWEIIYSLKSNLDNYPEVVAAFYMTATKVEAKVRINAIFEILFGCADHIKDPELKRKVAEIKLWERIPDANGLVVPTEVADTTPLADLIDEICPIVEKTEAKMGEVFAILDVYATKPANWWNFINPLKKDLVADGFYLTAEKKYAKIRIKDIINILFCCKDYITDAELKKKITDIEILMVDADDVVLKLPTCT